MWSRSALALALFASPAPTWAANSPWHRTDGGQVRLVVEDRAARGGVLRGALEIVLADGWKTYWRDPGDAGIPPQIDIAASTNVSAAAILFPEPHRFDDGYGAWAGYKGSVVLPVEFTVPDPARYSTIEADIFVGICDEVCVPVQARLSVAGGAPGDDALVDAAFAALPAAADAQLRIEAVDDAGGALVAAAVGADSTAELFVVTPPGWTLGVPRRTSNDGSTAFTIPVLSRPKAGAGPIVFDYTLVSGERAVSGSATLE